jgi:hypothetical protein
MRSTVPNGNVIIRQSELPAPAARGDRKDSFIIGSQIFFAPVSIERVMGVWDRLHRLERALEPGCSIAQTSVTPSKLCKAKLLRDTGVAQLCVVGQGSSWCILRCRNPVGITRDCDARVDDLGALRLIIA